MVAGFGKQHQRGRFQPGTDLVERQVDRRRRVEHARMRRDRQELVHTGPWNRPRARTAGKRLDAPISRIMKRAILPVGVDQDIRIDRDHCPPPTS